MIAKTAIQRMPDVEHPPGVLFTQRIAASQIGDLVSETMQLFQGGHGVCVHYAAPAFSFSTARRAASDIGTVRSA